MSPAVRPLLAPPAAPGPHAQQVDLLERELTSPRRLAGGLAAVVCGLAASVFLAVALFPSDTGIRLVAVAAGGLLGAGAIALGAPVLRAGRGIVDAYVAWSDQDTGPPPPPRSMARRALSGAAMARSAATAVCLIGALFALTVLGLGLAPGDPLAIDDERAGIALLGAVGAAVLGVATGALLRADLRSSQAYGRRVGRGISERRGR